jgi:hypothetical protein
MGGTGLVEFVLYVLDQEISIVKEALDILRGLAVLYLCVIDNVKVRRAIFSRLIKPKVTPQISIKGTKSIYSSTQAEATL